MKKKSRIEPVKEEKENLEVTETLENDVTSEDNTPETVTPDDNTTEELIPEEMIPEEMIPEEMIPEELIPDKKKLQFYEQLRQTVRSAVAGKAGGKYNKIVGYLLTLPDFFILLTRLALDKRVTKFQKLFIGGIIGYLIMPLDLIPDFIPVFGFVDDLVMVVFGLNTMLNEIDPIVVQENWSGDEDVLELLQKITHTAEEFLDKKILKKIKMWIEKMGKK